MPLNSRKPTLQTPTTPEVYPSDPIEFAQSLLHFHPDPPQSNLLRLNPHRCVLNCCRQWGKSTITVIKAVHAALTTPNSLTLILSPSGRQSGEFLEKASHFLRHLGIRPRGDGRNEISLLFPNRSRIVGVPSKNGTIRGFSNVNFLLVDEASWVPDDVYHAVRPMLATSNGQLWLLSTPDLTSGFFYDTWTSAAPNWTRLAVPATECPRISAEFLAEERLIKTPAAFAREYLCQFTGAADAVFSPEQFPGFLTSTPSLRLGQLIIPVTPYARDLIKAVRFYIAADLGQVLGYTAICIIERAEVIAGPRDLATYKYPAKVMYTIRHLERIPHKTSYPDIVERLAALTRHPALGEHKTLVIDSTGVGRPIRDLLSRARLGCPFYAVNITGGDHQHQSEGYWHVPRRHLLTNLEIALTQGSLKICDELAELPNFRQELLALRHGQKQSGTTDDLVFATALANWRATLFPN